MKTRKFRPLTDSQEKLYGAIDANPEQFSVEAAVRRSENMVKEISYLHLLGTLYLLHEKIRREGGVAIESDIDNPSKSPIFNTFQKYDNLDKSVYTFVCDVLRLITQTGIAYPDPVERYMDACIGSSKLNQYQARLFECVRIFILCQLDSYNPGLCAEFGRQGIPAEHRTSYQELDNFILKLKNQTAPTRESVNAMIDNIFQPHQMEIKVYLRNY